MAWFRERGLSDDDRAGLSSACLPLADLALPAARRAAASGWRASATTATRRAEPAAWPAVVAVVPARDEADVIARSVGSLLAQDYPGAFRVILVDDEQQRRHRRRGARRGRAPGRGDRLEVLTGAPLPAGWTGKLWAMQPGRRARPRPTRRTICWLTDADIAHAPDNLRRLVGARRGRRAGR